MERCRKSIDILVKEIGIDADTAYKSLLFTALLTDLHPEDEEVVNIILQDCGIEVRA